MIFTAQEGTPLTKDLIEKAIAWNERKRSDYDELANYYIGEHNILYRQKPLSSKNSKLVINHAKYITDTNVGYMLGKPVEYSSELDIDPVKEQFRQQNIPRVDRELAKKASKFGRAYDLTYNDGNNIRTVDLDVRNCVMIYDDTVQHNEMYAVVYKRGVERKGLKQDDTYQYITVYDSLGYKNCLNATGTISVPEEYDVEHSFGLVPVTEYRNNSEFLGDYEIVKSLIDAYNLTQSDRVNDKEQLVDAIMVAYGLGELTPEQKDSLRKERMVLMPKDSKLEYLLKNLDEGQMDVLRQTLKEDIHKISMVPDFTDEKFVGNSSGVAISYKLLHFQWNISNKAMDFSEGLKKRFQLYNNYLVTLQQSKEIPAHEVDIVFTRNLPQNDYEVSQMINNLQGMATDTTLLEQLSFVEDADAEVEAKKEEDMEKFNAESPQYGTLKETEQSSKEEDYGPEKELEDYMGIEDEEKGLLERLLNKLK